jgi:hypothetical protein
MDCPDIEDCWPFAEILHTDLLNMVALYQIIYSKARKALQSLLHSKILLVLESLRSLCTELANQNTQQLKRTQTLSQNEQRAIEEVKKPRYMRKFSRKILS